MSTKHFACKVSEVPDTAAKIVKIQQFPIGIFRLDDGYHALLNVCPHKGAALCEGPVCGTAKPTDEREFVYDQPDELVRCAWHGWEFSIRTGEFIVNPKVKVRRFDVSVVDDDVFVHS